MDTTIQSPNEDVYMRPYINKLRESITQLQSVIHSIDDGFGVYHQSIQEDNIAIALSKTLDIYLDICSLEQSMAEFSPPSFPHNSATVSDEFSTNLFNVSFISENIFCAKLPIVPLKSSTKWRSKFSQIFNGPLQSAVSNSIPHGFKKFNSAYIIFVSHINTEASHPPYFDNDNVAIKTFLDCIVPYLCYDDATRYVDNYYCSVNDSATYSEIFVVKCGHLSEWISRNPYTKLSRELSEKVNISSQKTASFTCPKTG